MAHICRNLFAYGLLLLAMAACNLTATTPPEAPPEMQTAVAQTLQAVITPAGTSTRVASPVPATLSPTAAGTITGTGTATTTPTYSVPMLTVQESTNCRTGPGEQYQILFTYLEGKQLEIAGRSDTGDFWLVKAPESPTGTCWLWGEFVEVTGSYWAVASVTAPPTGTNPPPQQVILENWEFFCSGDTLNVTIIWFDRADNETGYRVFRNGEAVAELPANSTTYTEATELRAGQWAEYYIQVNTPNGSANSSIMRMTCG